MHSRLLICLAISIVVGLFTAGTALVQGYGVLVALALYSGAGSVTLVATATLGAVGEALLATRLPVPVGEPVHA